MRQSRRQFLRRAAVTPSLVCTLASEEWLQAQSSASTGYDLLVRGGRVVDPDRQLSDYRDVAISGRRIARVAPRIEEKEARQVLDARGQHQRSPGLRASPGTRDTARRSRGRRRRIRDGGGRV